MWAPSCVLYQERVRLGLPTGSSAPHTTLRNKRILSFYVPEATEVFPFVTCCGRGIFPGEEASRAWSPSFRPPSAETKNAWNCTYTSLYAFMACRESIMPDVRTFQRSSVFHRSGHCLGTSWIWRQTFVPKCVLLCSDLNWIMSLKTGSCLSPEVRFVCVLFIVLC